MTDEQLREALRSLLWPNVPSADDIALLIRTSSGSQESSDKAMILVERLREAQANAEQLLEGTTNVTPVVRLGSHRRCKRG